MSLNTVVHGLIWLGNDTVSLWHGTSVSITVDQCLRYPKERESLTKRKKGYNVLL